MCVCVCVCVFCFLYWWNLKKSYIAQLPTRYSNASKLFSIARRNNFIKLDY